MDRPTLALTLGDPAGIGPEIMAKALAEGSAYELMKPVADTVRQPCEVAIGDGCAVGGRLFYRDLFWITADGVLENLMERDRGHV